MPIDKNKVIIAGGGIAGPALALFLHRAGIPSEVYEAYPPLERPGGGFNIAPNGMNVLHELGLADTVAAKGTRTLHAVFRSEKRRELGRIGYGDPKKYGQPA